MSRIHVAMLATAALMLVPASGAQAKPKHHAAVTAITAAPGSSRRRSRSATSSRTSARCRTSPT